MMNREAREELYDPKKQRKGSWLDFVKAHKNMRTKKGLLDLKAISKLWKAQGHKKKALDPAPKKHKKSSWLNFVKAHKHMKNAKGMLDLKGISKLWHKR